MKEQKFGSRQTRLDTRLFRYSGIHCPNDKRYRIRNVATAAAYSLSLSGVCNVCIGLQKWPKQKQQEFMRPNS